MKTGKKYLKKKKPAKNTPVNASAVVIVSFIVLSAAAIIFYTAKEKDFSGSMAQKSVDAVTLPAGMKMKVPAGYTAFKSQMYGMLVYTFVKYEESWKDNMFFRLDLTVVPQKEIGLEKSKISVLNPELSGLVAARKILLQEKRELELQKEDKEAVSYEIDYRSFQPENVFPEQIKGRQWNRYNLIKYEGSRAGNRIKEWANIYTVQKGYTIILDYAVVKGFVDEKSKKPILNVDFLKTIAVEINAIVYGIDFN